MRRSSRRAGVLASGLTVLAVAGWGCGDGRPGVEGSNTEAKVRGKVIAAGKPATKGEVVFDPSNYKRKLEQARTAPINPDGTYEITTLVGENIIGARGPGLSAYSTQVQTFDVREGENTFDIQLPVPGTTD